MSDIFVPAVLLGDLVHAGLEDFLKKELNAELEVEGEKEIPVNGKAIKVKGRADAIINQNGEGIMENTPLPLIRHYVNTHAYKPRSHLMGSLSRESIEA
jgi:hypothetical protein